METVANFTFLGSKITAAGDSSHEIKRRLLLGRKVMTNIDSILKSKDTTFSLCQEPFFYLNPYHPGPNCLHFLPELLK